MSGMEFVLVRSICNGLPECLEWNLYWYAVYVTAFLDVWNGICVGTQ
jgi:hypothetical protein